jgi:hypothetical protein
VVAQDVDPAVTRRKFDREIEEYHRLSKDYRQRGWFLLYAEYPNVLVAFASSKVKPAALVMGVQFDYTNYDAAPPSVRIVNPFTGEPLKFKELPNPLNRAVGQQEVPLMGMAPGQNVVLETMQPYMQAYGMDEIPFLCVAGVREYHEHPAHSGDLWELHRPSGAGRLVRLLNLIHTYGVAPIAGFNVQLVPQVTFKMGPPPP